MVTQLKEVLRNLCSNNGWSYAVFWSVNQRNSMLLTLEDAYYDEKVRILIEKMSQQAHIMGEGIIGEVAVTGKDQWMFTDTYCGKWNSVTSIDNQVVFQDNTEFYRQFSSRIETIAVISVAPLGVIQFGSTQRISERLEFVNQIKSLFQHLGRIDELLLSGNAPSVLNSEIYDPSGFLPSAVDFENYYSSCDARVMQSVTSNDLIRRTQTAKALSLPFPITSGLYNAGMSSSTNPSSLHHKHQFQPAQVILSTPKLELQQPSLNSGCISNLEVGFQVGGSQADYFADFAVENLFNEIVGNPFSDTKPKSEEQLSTSVVTRTGGASQDMNQVQSTSISCLGGSMDAFVPKLDPERMEKSDMNPTCKDNLVKSQLGAWVEDSYSINSGSAVTTNSKEPGQQGNETRKRARPGESTRPRPKDRQLIQDRVKELREIVPNGAKCSIDSLLDRTIKHMLFLQGVTKYSDTLKQAEEPKIISEDGVVLKENSSVGGGATWALEVGGKSMFCPILVEDLSSKGQMLVEMLCEERGFFLEIADKIRGFGLTILKGVMEARNDKIWARFIVEAHRDVTRMDIFLSLANLLQQTETSWINSSKQPTKVLDSIIPHLKEYQQNLQCYTQSV